MCNPTTSKLWAQLLVLVGCLSVLGGCAGLTSGVEANHTKPEVSAAKPLDLSGDLMFKLLAGELAVRRGELSVAVQSLLAASRESDDPRVAERATRVAIYARADASALTAAHRWLELDPASLEARQVLAILHVRADRAAAAVAQLKVVIERLDGGRERGLEVAAALLLREKNARVGLEVMTQLASLHDDVAVAHFSVGRLAERAGERDLAVEAISRALSLKPDYTQAHLLRAQLVIDQGDSEQAFTDLQQAVKRYPKDQQLRLGYARLLVQAGQYQAATEQFKTLYQQYPDNAEILFALGLLAIESRRLDAAQTYLNRVVELGYRPEDAHYYLGRIAENRKAYQTAIEHYSHAQRGDNALDAQVRSAEMLGRLGQVERARDTLETLRFRYSDDLDAIRFYLAEAEILRVNKRYQDALEVLNTALERFPEDDDLLYSRALIAEQLDLLQVFEADLRSMLSRDADNAHALNALGYGFVDRQQRLAEARVLLLRAIELRPDDPAIIDSVGWLYYRLGQHDLALEYLRRAHGMLQDPEVAAHLGEVLWVTGAQREAQSIWDDALQQSPENESLLEVIDRFNP